MKLNELADNPGAARTPRPPRGAASAAARAEPPAVATRGRSRAAEPSLNGFEGGQMPLYRRLPKHGFRNVFRKRMTEVNVGRLQQAVDAGKLDPQAPVTAAAMKSAGVIRRMRDGVRLLGRGELAAALVVEAAACVEKRRRRGR